MSYLSSGPGELWGCTGAGGCATRTGDRLPAGERGRAALSPTLSIDFLFSLLRLGVAGATDGKARLRASCLPGSGVGRRATAPGLCWSLHPPQEPCLGVGERWPSGSAMSVGSAGLGQASTARAALAQPRLSPSVPHGPVSPKSLSPNSCPGWLFRSRQLLAPAAPCCARLERADLRRQRGRVRLLPARCAEEQHERVAGGGVCRGGCCPPVSVTLGLSSSWLAGHGDPS